MSASKLLKSNKLLTKVSDHEIRDLLELKASTYNRPTFIEQDPISIPHKFSTLQDIEIAGFWTAMLSWGQRKTILNKANELMNLMDWAPHDFVLNHEETDLKRFESFKHRTFQSDDTLYFIEFFKYHYSQNESLQDAFFPRKNMSVKEALSTFHEYFFSLPDFLQRTKKHVSTPARKSSCKRLNMFLRWMVRNDGAGVDFGIWDKVSPSDLMIPLDIHVFNVSRKLGLLQRDKTDWQAVEELTLQLKEFDSSDPVKYDFALFSIGVLEKD